jgi:hypothetical protein
MRATFTDARHQHGCKVLSGYETKGGWKLQTKVHNGMCCVRLLVASSMQH